MSFGGDDLTKEKGGLPGCERVCNYGETLMITEIGERRANHGEGSGVWHGGR
jgi:hypothetical protein